MPQSFTCSAKSKWHLLFMQMFTNLSMAYSTCLYHIPSPMHSIQSSFYAHLFEVFTPFTHLANLQHFLLCALIFRVTLFGWVRCIRLTPYFWWEYNFQTRSQHCEKWLLDSSCLCLLVLFHWTDFHGTWYLIIFRKSVEEIYFWLKSDKNNGYFTWRMKGVSNKSCRQNQNTHFMFNKLISENSALYEIILKER